MRRAVVVGVSGSGKTRLAKQIGELLNIPHIELDGIFWQKNWTRLPRDEFEARVKEASAGASWVVDGNYSATIREIVWSAADTVIWLDLRRWTVMRQLAWRTIRRSVTRVELWNGNRERGIRDQLSLDRNKSILLWSWTTYRTTKAQYTAAIDDAKFSHIGFVRLKSRREITRFLEGFPAKAA